MLPTPMLQVNSPLETGSGT